VVKDRWVARNSILLRALLLLIDTEVLLNVAHKVGQVLATVHVSGTLNINNVFVLLVLEGSVSVTPTLLVEVVELDFLVRMEINQFRVNVLTILDSLSANLSAFGELSVK